MAIFVFMVILILFFGILASMSAPEQGQKLTKDAELITKALTGRTENAVVENNKVDNEKLVELNHDDGTGQINYNQLRQELGIKGDFCIYFEDSDGNLIPVLVKTEDPMNTLDDPSDDTYIYVNGVGADGALINEQKCGVEYS